MKSPGRGGQATTFLTAAVATEEVNGSLMLASTFKLQVRRKSRCQRLSINFARAAFISAGVVKKLLFSSHNLSSDTKGV